MSRKQISWFNLDYYSLMNEVRSYAALHNINLVLSEETIVPNVTITASGQKTVNLSKPNPYWSKDAIVHWRGEFYHEIGHFATELDDINTLVEEEKIGIGSMLHSGVNAIEDCRNEKNQLGVYRGRDITLDVTYASIVKRILDKNKVELSQLEFKPKSEGAFHSALLWLSTASRTEWQHSSTGLDQLHYDISHPTMQAKFDAIEKAGLVERVTTVTTAKQVLDIVNEVLTIMEFSPEEEAEKAKQAYENGEGKGKGDKGKEQGKEGDSEGKGNGEGHGGKRKKGEGDEDGEGDNEEDVTIDWRDLSPRQHDTERPSMSSVTINQEGRTDAGDFVLADAKDLKIYNFVTNPHPEFEAHTGYKRSVERNLRSAGHGLANKIRKLLLVKTQTHRIHGKKSGKMSAKNVYRVTLPENVGSRRENIFNRKEQKYDLDDSVLILIDFSGSMGGTKLETAMTSCIMINDAISKIGVPVEIQTFTETGRSSLITICKEFDKRISNDALLHNLCKASRKMSQNADGEAILYAYSKLKQRTSKRKLLLVLSDGQPASNRSGEYTFTQDVTKMIQQKKEVELYGLGILTDSVKYFYKNYSVIRDINKLEDSVLSIIKQHIIK